MKEKNHSESDQLIGRENCRSDERQPVQRAADLVLDQRQTPVACLIKDVSKTGLKLIYDSPHGLPERVKIILHHPNEVLECEVMWQREKEVGLRIVEAE